MFHSSMLRISAGAKDRPVSWNESLLTLVTPESIKELLNTAGFR
jgi:hypothetical protein